MNRRDFVISGTAATAGIVLAQLMPPAQPGPSPAGAGGPATSLTVIYDARFPAARSFADGAEGRGYRSRSIAGDVTSLWFDELQPVWARGDEPVLGMTTAQSLFCLEQLAWNHWKRVVSRIEHRFEPNGSVTHRLVARRPIAVEGRVALTAGADWPRQLGAALAKQLSEGSVGAAIRASAVSHSDSRVGPTPSLVSWIIAG